MGIQLKKKINAAMLLKAIISIGALVMPIISAIAWFSESPNADMYMWITAGLILVVSVARQQDKEEKINKFEKQLADNENGIILVDTYEASYLGGHPSQIVENPIKGILGISDGKLGFESTHSESIDFTIFLEDVLQVSAETRESLTVGRLLLEGVLTFALKKKDKFLRINFKNDLGETSLIIFETPKANWLAQKLKQKRYRYLAAQQRQNFTAQSTT